MVLVTRESGPSGEGFLAVCVRAFIRPLAGVYATMPRERTRVAKRLLATR